MYNNKSLLVAFFATIVRYYDYALFGLSASILSKNFMPGDDAEQMFGFFIIFSLSTIARPCGAMIFGPIGDRLGRVASIKIATALASISTLIIAFIPHFSSWGVGSILFLTFSRMLFLLSLSGDIDATKIFVVEVVGKKNKHMAIAAVTFCSQIGVIFASILYHMALSFNDVDWLWRGNFIIGGLLGVVVILLRNNLQESEEFLQSQSNDQTELAKSTWVLLLEHKGKFCIASVMNGLIGSGYHFLIIFLGAFMSYTADVIDQSQASLNNIILISSYGLSCLLAGYVSEKLQNIWQPICTLCLSIILLITLMIQGYQNILWIHNLLIIIVPFYSIPSVIYIQHLFATPNRMRMCSLSHSIGSMLFSSSTPMICMMIWRYSESVNAVISYFLLGIIILLCCFLNRVDQN